METELRCIRGTLRILGAGVILFHVWALVKPFLFMLMVEESDGKTAEAIRETPDVAAVLIMIILLFVLSGAALRLWVGLSALAEGRGKMKGRAYVRMAFLMFFFQLLGLAAAVFAVIKVGVEEDELLKTATSFMLEVCSVTTVGALAFTAAKGKRLSRLTESKVG